MSVSSGPSPLALPGRERRALYRARLRAWAPLLVLIGLCLLIDIGNPRFLTIANLVRVATAAAIPLVLALGTTFVILLGSIDLSLEGVLAVGSVLTSLLAANDANSLSFGLAVVPVAVLAGALIGALNGALHVGFRIPSFMVTLGIWFAGVGLATVLLGGGTVRVLEPLVRDVALARVLDLPVLVWIALAVLLLAWVIQEYTPLGRYMYVIGGGEDIAALSGIPINRTKVAVFTLAGAFYGLGGVMAAAQLGVGNAMIGDGRLFPSVTAVVVGGTSLIGGEGGVLNSLVGVMIVTVLANGLVLLGVSPYLQQAIQGLMIIAAVAVSIDRVRSAIVK